MTRLQEFPILSQLRSAKTYPEQTAALRVLKNEIIGHIQKKELWIKLGVLQPIVRTLSGSASSPQANGKSPRHQFPASSLSEEDAVKLQALQLVGSFANGGPKFLVPFNAAQVLPAVLSNVSPSANAPQIVVAAMRALTEIANAVLLEKSPGSAASLADSLFQPRHLDSFNQMLATSSADSLLQNQARLAAGLIATICHEERHLNALTAAGTLDLLAARLASFAVAGGHVVPGADLLAHNDGLSDAFPEPAPPSAKIGPYLEAVAAVVGKSKYRAHRLVYSPAITAVFPAIKFEPVKGLQDPRQDPELSGVRGVQQHDLTAMEYILPALPSIMSRTALQSLSGMQSAEQSDSPHDSGRSSSRFESTGSVSNNRVGPSLQSGYTESEELESPLIPWLIHLIRTSSDAERLSAVMIVTHLFRAGLGSTGLREPSLGLLVVPVLVDMIAKASKQPPVPGPDVRRRKVLEQAPLALATLITDKNTLVRATYECGAVRVLSRLLKQVYEPVDNVGKSRYWEPQPDAEMDVGSPSLISELGEDGWHPEVQHRVRVRENILRAIGALANSHEDYRKALIAENIVPYVVESLSPHPKWPKLSKDRPKEKPSVDAPIPPVDPAYGENSTQVMIAACNVVKALARSIGILRTALVDQNVAAPIFSFLKHRDIDMQCAASAAMANLLVEVSPTREYLTEFGVMHVLCEQAHSDNPTLRLNAIWALKHFVDAVAPDMRKKCLDELEPGWLVKLVCDDTQDTALYSRLSRSDDTDDDVDMHSSAEPVRWVCGTDGTVRELDASDSSRLRQSAEKLNLVQESESNPVRKARTEDVAIQEQALDYIRNLIGRPNSDGDQELPNETAEMIEYIFSVLGQDRLFEILASKLRSKILHPYTRRTPVPGREPRTLYPTPRLIEAVVYVVVHIAGCLPSHRQLVTAQTELLKLIAQHSTNRDRGVKAAICHLVTNLAFQEDANEAPAWSERVQELKRLGFLEKMETMMTSDTEANVRERAKEAVHALREPPATY